MKITFIPDLEFGEPFLEEIENQVHAKVVESGGESDTATYQVRVEVDVTFESMQEPMQPESA